jgi:sulfur-carrier protein
MTARSSPHEAATVVRVHVPSPLRSYTGATEVGVAVPVLAPERPPTVRAVLASIDDAYPGMRFRIVDEQGQLRCHIKLCIGNTLTRDLATPIPPGDVLMIVAALSGG